MSYEDFQVRITAGSAGRVRIGIECEAGDDAVEAVPEIEPDAAERLAFEFRAAAERRGASRLVDLREHGRRLFSCMLPAHLRRLWDRSLASAVDRGRGVRLRIHLDLRSRELAWLWALPWEIVFDEDSGGFVALDGRSPVIRYLDVRQPRPPFPDVRPWRVLVIASQAGGRGELDLEKERQLLLDTWGGGDDVSLVFPETATFEAIRRELTKGPIHGIHYLGHGVFDQHTGEGALVLQANSGEERTLGGEALQKLVKGIRPPALAVLNGCHGGRLGGEGSAAPFGGAAAALMAAGVPAVVAMQVAIRDEEAVCFSKILYRALQDRHPVDWAVSEARLVLSEEFRDRPVWAIPALYLRVADGRIFAKPEIADSEDSPISVTATTRLENATVGDSVNVGEEGAVGAGGAEASEINARTEVYGGSVKRVVNVGRRRGRT